MAELLVFGSVILLASIAPGPDFAMVVRNTMLSGRVAGMWTATGIALGVAIWVVTTSFGLAALLAASAAAFTVVKLVGAAYLAYLGVRSIIAAFKDGRRPRTEPVLDRTMGAAAAFRSGLLCNVLNPKAAVFFVALMPQFIGSGAHWAAVGELAVVATLSNGVWFLVLANLLGLLRRVLSRPRVRAWINGVTGAVMVALGVRVAAS